MNISHSISTAGPPLSLMNTTEDQVQRTVHINVNVSDATKFGGKTYDLLSNGMNKLSLIHMIAERLQQKGSSVIYAEADTDVDIVTASVTMSSYKSTTLIGEDTYLLVLLYDGATEGKEVYFRPDKGTPHIYIYNINILKQLLGDDVCLNLLFAHALSGCDTISQIFGVGKKSVFRRDVEVDSVLCTCSKMFCAPKPDKIAIETAGCKTMASLFNGTKSDSLETGHSKVIRDTRKTASNNFSHKPSLSTYLPTCYGVDGQECRHGSY